MKSKSLLLVLLSLLLVACSEDKQNLFCVRYKVLYEELQSPRAPSDEEIELQLRQRLSDSSGKDAEAQFMRFVYRDFKSGMVAENEDPHSFCMRLERWKGFRPPA